MGHHLISVRRTSYVLEILLCCVGIASIMWKVFMSDKIFLLMWEGDIFSYLHREPSFLFLSWSRRLEDTNDFEHCVQFVPGGLHFSHKYKKSLGNIWHQNYLRGMSVRNWRLAKRNKECKSSFAYFTASNDIKFKFYITQMIRLSFVQLKLIVIHQNMTLWHSNNCFVSMWFSIF